ncbi:MAG TPA: V-type ATP synthase subunit F [Gaiellaceae bacterium]|nr:V-type ATP synthase subunit F [Gaiellaceae bacterium]
MTRVVAIGDERRLGGFALAGVEIVHAAGAADAAAAWEALADDVALVVLDSESYPALAARLDERPEVLWAVLPE